MTTIEGPNLVDIDAAAAYLDVSVRFMRRMIAERRITHCKIGKYVRFDTAVLDAYIEERTVHARPRRR
mgnify:CR=1 FL=1